MNKIAISLSTAAVLFSLSWGAYADSPKFDKAENNGRVLLAQQLLEAYNDTFNCNQAGILKALPFPVVYYPVDDFYFVLEEVRVTSQGPYCTYKLTYYSNDGGQLTVEGCNGGIGDIPLKSGFNAYTVSTPFGRGQAYLKSGSAKNKAVFYSQWIEYKPNVYCRYEAKNVPDRYIKSLSTALTKLD